MKIIIHEAVSYKLESKNINCNNYPLVQTKEKTTRYVYFIVFLLMFLTTPGLYAQIELLTKQVKKVEVPEEENLNVFHDWITWNNPGSAALNFLTRQAEDYYKTRDEQIAKLKTKDDWQKRQQLVITKIFFR